MLLWRDHARPTHGRGGGARLKIPKELGRVGTDLLLELLACRRAQLDGVGGRTADGRLEDEGAVRLGDQAEKPGGEQSRSETSRVGEGCWQGVRAGRRPTVRTL